MWKFLAHMLADVAEVEGLEVAEMHGVEQHQYRHHLAVGKTARTVATYNFLDTFLTSNSRLNKLYSRLLRCG